MPTNIPTTDRMIYQGLANLIREKLGVDTQYLPYQLEPVIRANWLSIPMPDVEQGTPEISVSPDGLITAVVYQEGGHVQEGTKVATLQMITQAGKTVVPLDVEQLAVPAGVFTIGPIYVAAGGTTQEVIAQLGLRVTAEGLITAYIKVIQGHLKDGDQEIQRQLPIIEEQTIVPGQNNQTIPAYHWLVGDQTILGDEDLLPENIRKGVNIFGIDGAFEGTRDTPGTATPATVFKDYICWVNGERIVGTYVPELPSSVGLILADFTEVIDALENITVMNYDIDVFRYNGNVIMDRNAPESYSVVNELENITVLSGWV